MNELLMPRCLAAVAGLGALLLVLAAAPAGAYEEMYLKGVARACYFAYYPSEGVMWVKLDFTRKNVRWTPVAELGKTLTAVEVTVIKHGSSKALLKTSLPVKEALSAETPLKLSKLEGEYEVRFTVPGPEGPIVVTKPFERRKFPWEGNKLGITDEVYSPFEPIRVQGNEVGVVLRKLKLNGFGLWESVVSEGRELLAAPMTVRYETAAGEGRWDATTVKNDKALPHLAVFRAEAAAGPVKLRAVCSVEMDGCMKVEMSLLPGSKPQELKRLWLEIPLKSAETPLFHEVTDGLRFNYAGDTPAGTGVVWEGNQAARGSTLWRNPFVSYLWLGGVTRGVAWFGENDRGWVTEKGGSKRSLQEIVREGDRVTLRVYLVNTPVTLKEERKLVFGLQASPTKPLPADWRAQARHIPGGSGPVNPWGGLYCAYKGPYRGDWQIVDKIIEGQKTGQVQEQWLADYAAKHNPPPIYGTWNWLESVKWFSGLRWRPVMTYQEEMGAPATEPDFRTFQDEWSTTNYTTRDWPDESILRRGMNASPGGGGAFPPSYRDYGAWYANEWLKRGVGPYWDNTFPKLSFNLRNSAAYVAEDGAVQPAMNLWNQREYHQRVWNLMQYWRSHQKDPLEWSNHMTNTLLLPIQTWGTVNLDNELSSDKPFPPDRDRAETMGRQVGSYGYSLYALYGTENPLLAALLKAKPAAGERINWGMKMVHEILRGGYVGGDSVEPGERKEPSLERRVYDFGYGTEGVQVHNYWDETPALQVGNAQVKWIALARAADKTVLVVLQSWAAEGVTVNVTLNPAILGFACGARGVDEETGAALPQDKPGLWPVELPGPYGTRMIRCSG